MDGETPAQVTPPPTFPETKPAESTPPEVATPAEPANQDPAADPGPGGEKKEGSEPTKTDDPAKSEPEKPKEQERIVPERYELKLSENSLLDPQSLARLETYARSQKLTQEEAAGLVQAQEEDVQAYVAEKKAAWLKEVQEDREIGGANLQRNVETAKQFLAKHADDGLRRELDRTGYGNYPGFMRFVLKLARMSENDRAVMPGSNPGAPEKSIADHFYSETTSKKSNN